MNPDFKSLLLESPIPFSWNKLIYNNNGDATDIEYILANKAFEQETGLCAADIAGKRMRELIPYLENETFNWLSFYAEVAKTKKSNSTTQFVKASGKWYNVTAFTNEYGFVAAIFRDITQEVEEKNHSKINETRLSQWKSLEGVYEVHTDLSGHYLYMNDLFQQDFKVPASEFTGKYSLDSICAEDHEKVKAAMQALLREPKAPIILEILKPFRNGKLVQTKWSFSIIHDDFGRPEKVLCIGLDNHELHLLREKTRYQDLVFREIFEAILAGYWDWNISDNTEYLSPAFKKMFGYEDHELENHPDTWQKLIFPEDRLKVKTLYGKHVDSKGKVPFSLEVRYRHKDGSVVWVICAGRVIQWQDDGTPIRMIGCHIDISAIKQMEDELSENRQLLESVLNTQKEMICRYLPDTTLTFVNEAYCKAFNMTQNELLGRKFIEFIPDEDKPSAYSQIASITPSSPVVTQSHKTQLPDGSLVVQEWTDTGIFDENGNAISYQSSGIDVTQRFIALEQFKESDHKFQEIMNNLPLVVWLRDKRNEKILFVNKAYEVIWGRPAQALYDNPNAYAETIHPDDLPSFQEAVESFLKEGFFSCDYRIMRPDGIIRWVSSKQYPVLNDKGEVVRYTGMAVDVTEAKEGALRIIRQNETLRQIAWEQSHIVRQPIAKVLGIAQLLKTEKDLPAPDLNRFLDYLIESVTELDNMVKDIVNRSNEVEFELKKQEKPDNP